MKRIKKERKVHTIPPVEQVEVSHKHLGVRFIFFLIFVVIAIVSITWGIIYLTRTEKGWQEITVSTSETNCASDFNFVYYFEGSSLASTREYKRAGDKYGELCVNAYRLFSADDEFEGVHNVYYVNHHLNEEIEVDAVLYNAFAQVAASGNRILFGAPVQAFYDSTVWAIDEDAAKEYDPRYNEEINTFALSLLPYMNSAEHVKIEVLGESRIRLAVSAEYMSVIEEKGVQYVIDFSYLKNAFIIDYLANGLAEAGYTTGLLSSYDGYSRSLFNSDYTLNLFSKVGSQTYYAGTARYNVRRASMTLRAFAVSANDPLHRRYADGSITHVYFDLTDGVSKCGANYLITYSESKTCAEIALATYPLFITDVLDIEAVRALSSAEIYYVCPQEQIFYYNGSDLTFDFVSDYEGIEFRTEKR